jgi:hypothetical protein
VKIIPTGKGPIFVDDDDFLFVLGLSPYWSINSDGYAEASVGQMHKLIAERHGLFGNIDHQNQIRHDNQSANLRIATKSQNGANSSKHTSESGFKGVTWFGRDQKWKAQIMVNRKNYHLGYFHTPEEAARVYDRAALKFFGEFASLNFPKEIHDPQRTC